MEQNLVGDIEVPCQVGGQLLHLNVIRQDGNSVRIVVLLEHLVHVGHVVARCHDVQGVPSHKLGVGNVDLQVAARRLELVGGIHASEDERQGVQDVVMQRFGVGVVGRRHRLLGLNLTHGKRLFLRLIFHVFDRKELEFANVNQMGQRSELLLGNLAAHGFHVAVEHLDHLPGALVVFNGGFFLPRQDEEPPEVVPSAGPRTDADKVHSVVQPINGMLAPTRGDAIRDDDEVAARLPHVVEEAKVEHGQQQGTRADD